MHILSEAKPFGETINKTLKRGDTVLGVAEWESFILVKFTSRFKSRVKPFFF